MCQIFIWWWCWRAWYELLQQPKKKSTRKPFSTICIFMVMVTTTMSFSILYLSYYWYGWWWWSCLWTSITVYMYKSCKQPLLVFFLSILFSLSFIHTENVCVSNIIFLSFLNREIARLSHYTSSTTTTTHYFFLLLPISFSLYFWKKLEEAPQKLSSFHAPFIFRIWAKKKVVAQLQAYCNNFLLEELFLCV